MTTYLAEPTTTPDIAAGTWQLDLSRSSVEFHVRSFYGLITVKGSFHQYAGTLDLGREPAVELTIDAASLDTNNATRDRHLRSADFFHVEQHPEITFVSDRVQADGDLLEVSGRLAAAGKEVPVELDAILRARGDELEIEAETHTDHRLLGMTHNPLGIIRPPATLIVKGILVRSDGR
jgi:polyisoprenoid-binding protein YceI